MRWICGPSSRQCRDNGLIGPVLASGGSLSRLVQKGVVCKRRRARLWDAEAVGRVRLFFALIHWIGTHSPRCLFSRSLFGQESATARKAREATPVSFLDAALGVAYLYLHVQPRCFQRRGSLRYEAQCCSFGTHMQHEASPPALAQVVQHCSDVPN